MDFFNRRHSDSDTPQPDDETPATPAAATPQNSDEQEAVYEEPEVTRDVSARMFDTALGAGSDLEGKLNSDGNVRLDGRFVGTLNITENVLIGQTASIEADINAKNVTVAGHVRGNITGKKIHVLSTARIIGDITAEALITEDGAVIEGRVSMGTANNITANLPPSTTEHGTIQ